MWDYWMKIEYSSDEETIPIQKKWAISSGKGELRYDFKYKHILMLNQIVSVDILTEENKKHVLGTITGAGVGLVVLGPLGAVVGLLTGGNKKEVAIAVKLKDGRHFIARCNNKTYTMLLPYVAKNTESISEDTKECPMCAETVKAKAKICRFCRHVFDDVDVSE